MVADRLAIPCPQRIRLATLAAHGHYRTVLRARARGRGWPSSVKDRNTSASSADSGSPRLTMRNQLVRWLLPEQATLWRDEGVARAMRKRIPILRPACRLDVMQPMPQISQSSIDIEKIAARHFFIFLRT